MIMIESSLLVKAAVHYTYKSPFLDLMVYAVRSEGACSRSAVQPSYTD